MMTPQEVSSRAFSKALFGGYSMSMVDEFLDVLSEDYTALYNDNAILKNKLKVLSDTVEEYRATDDVMRKTLLSAQQMAESIIQDAQDKKAAILKEAEGLAKRRIEELKAQTAAEESRLKSAQEATASYVAHVDKLFEAQELMLRELTKLAPVPPKDETAEPEGSEAGVEEAAQDIENNLSQMLEKDEPAEEAPEKPSAPPAKRGGADLSATRRFDDLQFGKDYEIR